jgi:hypothetical protein
MNQTENSKLRFLHLLDVHGVRQIQGSILGWTGDFSLFQNVLPGCLSSYQTVLYHRLENDIIVKLNTHLHRTLSLRVGGAIPLLWLHVFRTWRNNSSNFAFDVNHNICGPPKKPIIREMTVCSREVSRRMTDVA